MASPERPSSPRPLAPLHSLSPPRPPHETFFSWDRTNGEVGPSGAHKSAGFPHSGPRDARTTRGDSRHGSPSVSREGSLRGGERFAGGSRSGSHDRDRNHQQGPARANASPPASRGGIDPGRRPLRRARVTTSAQPQRAQEAKLHPGVRASPGVRRHAGARRVPPPAPAPHRDAAAARAPERGVPRRRPGGWRGRARVHRGRGRVGDGRNLARGRKEDGGPHRVADVAGGRIG